MNPKTIVKLISALVAAAGGVLAVADTIVAMPNLPGWMVNAWPMVFAAATLIDRIGVAVINSLQDPPKP